LFFTPAIYAVDFENTTELSILPFSLSGASFMEEKKDMSGLFLTLSADKKFSSQNWRAEIAPEIRILMSDISIPRSLRSSVGFSDRSFLNQWKITSQDKSDISASIEKLNFSYQGENSELLIGRKPVSLGVLVVFPVWNKFSKPFVTNLGPSRVTSQDQLIFHGQLGNWAYQLLDIEQPAPFSSTRIGEFTWFGSGFELHALFADWWNQSTMGFAFSGDLLGTTLKLESLHIQEEGWQIGSGVERAFTESLSGIVEFLYLENGAASEREEFSVTPSLFRPLIAKWYGFARIVDKFSDLTTIEFGLLENLIDHSLFINPKISYSVSNDIDMSLEARLPTGTTTTELNRLNSPEQVLGGFRWVF
jgi:hypothetical protein